MKVEIVKNPVKLIRARADQSPTPISALERAIDQLLDQGASLCRQVEDLEAAQEVETDHEAILRNMAAIRAAQNRIRAIDAELVTAREALTAAKYAERDALLKSLKSEIAVAATEFHATTAIMIIAVDRLQAARAALDAHGFREAAMQYPPPPMIGSSLIVDQVLLDMFAANYAAIFQPVPLVLQKTRWLSNPLPAVGPAPGSTAPAARFSRFSPHGAVIPPPPPAPPRLVAEFTPHQGRREPLNEPGAPGHRRVIISRAGLEDEARGQLRPGDIIAVPSDAAVKMLQSGAADFAPDLPKPNAADPAKEKSA